MSVKTKRTIGPCRGVTWLYYVVLLWSRDFFPPLYLDPRFRPLLLKSFFFWDPRVKPGARRILGPFPTSWIFVFDRFLISFDLFFGILHPKAKGHRGYKGISHSLVRSVVSTVILT